jgi:hypothetical protein
VKQRQHLNRVFTLALITGLACVAVACQASTSLPQAIMPQTATSELTMTAPPSATLLPQPTMPMSSTTPIVGLGVLGDSNSDEYRADDDRGGQYAAVTFSWVELIAARRGLNLGAWDTWGEPRRTGYKYNWARSSATVHDAIISGQHTGLAEQVANGEVSHVIIWIGTNDFATWNGTYQEIYDGRLSGEALQAKIDTIATDITLAVDTILHAGKVKLLLVTIAERAISPDVMSQFPAAAGRRRVSDAIHTLNAQLIGMAAARGVAVVDSNVLMQALLQRVDKAGMLHVGSEQIRVFGKGGEPHNGQLDDDAGHPGTVLSGLIANEIFIRPFDEQFGAAIPLLSDEEILQSAGLPGSK